MPMGLRNSLATHQHYVTLTLKEYIRKICHVYLDDIVIWSQTLDKHKQNVSKIMEALRAVELFCSIKKSNLFMMEMDFLGHHISAHGIEADNSKVECIINWLKPTKAKHVQAFLGLIRYIANFLPALGEHTAILTPLTRKECNTKFPTWMQEH